MPNVEPLFEVKQHLGSIQEIFIYPFTRFAASSHEEA
jgi:hypothetical protein